MQKSTKSLKPKATRKDYEKYLDLTEQIKSSGKEGIINKEVYKACDELLDSLDWFDETFEENGKYGLKNILGELVLPAKFDSIGETWRLTYRAASIPVCIDGKYGLAKIGTGEMLTEPRFKMLLRYFDRGLFRFWEEGSEKFGLMYGNGEEMLPCCLDTIFEPCNNIIEFEADGKKGCYCTLFDTCVKPEYDDIDNEVDETLIFYKGDVAGYVHKDGRFFPLDYFKRMETDPTLEYIEQVDCLYNTCDF